MKDLEERFKNQHLLNVAERLQLEKELKRLRPEFLKPFRPAWWWWKRCKVNVLIVCDGSLNFDSGGFGLSEFLTAFNELEATSWVDYRVTLAHRGSIINSPNPVVVNHISNFKFDTSVNLNDFDQVWLFGIQSGGSITPNEINAVETYMNGGGGLFATGDHGSLGRTMCGNIPRVKDMRLWADTNANNDLNEVSMIGVRRNDTNRPAQGDVLSGFFDNQSDDIPQNIAVRTFGSGLPHPLLAIRKSLRPSGIIDVMPDHPHEGECAHEKVFTVNGVSVSSQIIATSYVLGGSTTVFRDKPRTIPHCFPSISVWDGRKASAGRIVVDSTWHHFVNVNLNGVGSGLDNGLQSGLQNADFIAVRQYYMNIATWMTRRRIWPCWWKWIIFDLLVNSQLIEASLNNPVEKIENISLADLNSIGALAEEILASRFGASFARSFMVDVISEFQPELADELDLFKPQDKSSKVRTDHYYGHWINLDYLLHTAIGSAFISLRDQKELSESLNEKSLDIIPDVFSKGLRLGFEAAQQNFAVNFKYASLFLTKKK